MAQKESQEVLKHGKKLQCSICEHDRFWSRKTLMNTRGATLLELDWANKQAVNYVCERCGYIFWFFEE